MAVQIKPLKFIRFHDGKFDLGIIHGTQIYRTADGSFSFNKHAGEWRVQMPTPSRSQYPACWQAFLLSGLRDARFGRRKDAVAAVEAFVQQAGV